MSRPGTAEHRPVAARAAASGFTRVVAVGDSLTEGVGAPAPGGLAGWPRQMVEILSARGRYVDLSNLAERGLTVREVHHRQASMAAALEPDVVTVMAGTNDVLRPRWDIGRFAADVDALFTAVTSAAPVVVTATLPDFTANAFLPPGAGPVARRRLARANDVLWTHASRRGFLLVDLWRIPAARDSRVWSVDRLHPNALGHRLLAYEVARLLDPSVVVPEVDELAAELADRLDNGVPQRAREAVWLARHAGPWLRGRAGILHG